MQTTRYLRARHSPPVESPDILHNGHRYRHVPFLPERRPAATGRIKTDWQLGNIQAAAPMPITSPGNDDDTGETISHTTENTAEPVEQTLKQNTNADNAFEAASFAQKAALRSTEEAIRNEASSSEENTNRMIPSDNPSESSTSTPMARILSADATAATHSDGQCDSIPRCRMARAVHHPNL